MGLLEDHGFEIVPECLIESEITCLTSALESTSVHRSRAGIRNAFEIQAVRALAFDARLMRFAKRALGENVLPFRATFFDKSPLSNWLVVWHQDTALPLLERRDVQGWGPWSTKEGVLCAHAPAHALEPNRRDEPLLQEPVLSDDAIHELTTRIDAADCLVTAGGLLLMRPLLVHASSKSAAAAPRRVLHIEYAGAASFPDGLQLPS